MWLNEIRLQRSRLLSTTIVTTHLGALIIAATMPLPPWLRVCLAVLILASMAHAMRHHVFRRSRYAAMGLKVTPKGLMFEALREGWMDCDILDTSFVMPWLTILHLKLPQRRLPVHVVLLPDMLGPDEFRRLRVWLKWGRSQAHGKDVEAML